MNNDLISREALKNLLLDSRPNDIQYSDINFLTGDIKVSLKFVLNIIDNAPTVDIKDQIVGAYNEGYMCGNKEAEKARPQGEWIDGGKDVTGQYFYDEFICNKCSVIVDNKSNFCPRCGADMRKGGAE